MICYPETCVLQGDCCPCVEASTVSSLLAELRDLPTLLVGDGCQALRESPVLIGHGYDFQEQVQS